MNKLIRIEWVSGCHKTTYEAHGCDVTSMSKKELMFFANVRLMFFAGNRSHAVPLFVLANVLPLNMLYFDTVCSLMHDISTNSAPQNICDLFTCSYLTFINTVYNTRFFDAGNLYILINQDWEFNLIAFPFSELSCGIAWSLTCVNLGNNLSKIKFINFYLRYLVMRMIVLMSLR